MDSQSDTDMNILDISGSPNKSPKSQNMEISKYPEYCKTMIVKDANGQVKELVFPKALDLDRPKRARTTFSQEQLLKLEDEFQHNQYLVGRERTELSRRLQLSETQIKVWFQNRRTKYKRDNKQKDQDSRTGENFSSGELVKLFPEKQATNSSIISTSTPSIKPLPISSISPILPYPPPPSLSVNLSSNVLAPLPPPYPHNIVPPNPQTATHFPFHLTAMTSQRAGIYSTSQRNYLPQS